MKATTESPPTSLKTNKQKRLQAAQATHSAKHQSDVLGDSDANHAHVPAQEFRTHHEQIYTPGASDVDQPPAALILNPRRTPLSLAAAANARADTLAKALAAWATVDRSDVTASELAGLLEPIAQEVGVLLDDLTLRLSYPGHLPTTG